jgi:hypothetical protein
MKPVDHKRVLDFLHLLIPSTSISHVVCFNSPKCINVEMEVFAKYTLAIRSRLSSNKPLRNGIIALVFALLLLYLYIDNTYLIPTAHPDSLYGKTLRSTSELARNSTLGFEKIFYISLP